MLCILDYCVHEVVTATQFPEFSSAEKFREFTLDCIHGMSCFYFFVDNTESRFYQVLGSCLSQLRSAGKNPGSSRHETGVGGTTTKLTWVWVRPWVRPGLDLIGGRGWLRQRCANYSV